MYVWTYIKINNYSNKYRVCLAKQNDSKNNNYNSTQCYSYCKWIIPNCNYFSLFTDEKIKQEFNYLDMNTH